MHPQSAIEQVYLPHNQGDQNMLCVEHQCSISVCVYVLLERTCVFVFYLIGAHVVVVLLNHINHCQSSVLIGQLTLESAPSSCDFAITPLYRVWKIPFLRCAFCWTPVCLFVSLLLPGLTAFLLVFLYILSLPLSPPCSEQKVVCS